MKDLEKIYKALGNRRRLGIIKLLKQKQRASVGEIAEYLKLSFRATSRHLVVLRNVDILDREQVGTVVFYNLDTQNPLIKYLLTIV